MDHLARLYYFRYLRQLTELKRFLKVNPSLFPLIVYLISSAAGLFYLTCLLSYFGFDGLQHIRLGDFFTIIFSSLGLMLTFVGVIIFGIFIIPLDKKLTSVKFLGLGKVLFKLNLPFLKAPLLVAFCSALFAVFVNAYSMAKIDARHIKQSQEDLVTVSFNYPVNWLGKTTTTLEESKIIASTSRYVFIFHPVTKKSSVVPLSNIATVIKARAKGDE
jgi:hypothetical protein